MKSLSKQKMFQRILSGYYSEHMMVETELWEYMKKHCHWSLTLSSDGYNYVAFKMVNGDHYIKQVYENGAEWHRDLKSCMKEMGLL